MLKDLLLNIVQRFHVEGCLVSLSINDFLLQFFFRFSKIMTATGYLEKKAVKFWTIQINLKS